MSRQHVLITCMRWHNDIGLAIKVQATHCAIVDMPGANYLEGIRQNVYANEVCRQTIASLRFPSAIIKTHVGIDVHHLDSSNLPALK